MAGDLDRKVKFDVTADTRNAIAGFKAAGQSADELGNKAKQAGEKGKQGMDKMAQGAQKAKVDMAAVAVAIKANTEQIAGMAQQILDFDSKLIALDKTIIGLESQEIALRRSIEDLNDAVAKGTITERDYQRALEDIELAYKNVQLETKNVAAETRKLDGEFVTFGINAIGTIAQTANAFVAMGISGTGALSAIVGGIGAVRVALTTILTHPVFLAFAAALAIWETNLFNIRGAIQDTFGTGTLSIIENVQNAFTGLTEGENSMEELNRQTEEYRNTVESGLPVWGSQAEKLDEVGNSAERASKKIKGLTIAQEQLMRSGGFRAGGGTSLSAAIDRETDNIEEASMRTLVAASLHEALKTAGIKGSLFGRNISGSIFNRAASASSFSSASRVNGLSISGSGQRFTGIGGLTRSSKRRRRNRNPRGRHDKVGVYLENLRKKWRAGLSKEFGLDIIGFTGTDTFGRQRSMHPSFGGNSAMGKDDIRNAMVSNFHSMIARREEEAKRRFNNFRSVTGGLSIDEALQFLEVGGFGSLQDTFSDQFRHKDRMQEIIQARNFFRRQGVDFDGMQIMGIAGLLNIREFGYREMNEQLAFQGKEQFQTVGT